MAQIKLDEFFERGKIKTGRFPETWLMKCTISTFEILEGNQAKLMNVTIQCHFHNPSAKFKPLEFSPGQAMRQSWGG
jgi:hypothetical protein